MASIQILSIVDRGSDGDLSKQPATTGFVRNDDYWLDRIANDKWAKDQGLRTGSAIRYRLDKLPQGYSGWEKTRSTGQNHIDRYMYGHPNGHFRSIQTFYKHFKFLMDHGHTGGCDCELCDKKSAPRKRPSLAPAVSESNPENFNFRKPPQSSQSKGKKPQPPPATDGHSTPQPRKKQVDVESTPDVYRFLIDQLELAAPQQLDQPIAELASPDWRAANQGLKTILAAYRALPNFVPRQGEVVLFVRSLASNQSIHWHPTQRTFCIVDRQDDGRRIWLEQAKWEAGVITQMPVEKLTAEDLLAIAPNKQHGLNDSGFRIQPLAQPNSVQKTQEKQYKYIPLHAIRPFVLWKECMAGLDYENWPSTIKHALAVTNSFTVISRYHFRGSWPDAAVFSRGVYIGHELVLVGDFVRLAPRSGEEPSEVVNDILRVTSIKLIFVDLDEASNDDYDEGRPYGVCLHISGYKYTQDPARSFDKIGKLPISAADEVLPRGLLALGQWYYCANPDSDENKTELPYQRIIGRCHEKAAIDAWYTLPADLQPPSSFASVNAVPVKEQSLSHGLEGIIEARDYSTRQDSRIEEGRRCFFADTRVEQLDMQEINGVKVGIMDGTRDQDTFEDWRQALRVLDGNKSAIDAYQASLKLRQEEAVRTQTQLAGSSNTLVAGAATAVDNSDEDADDVMDVDEMVSEGHPQQVEDEMEIDNTSNGRRAQYQPQVHRMADVVNLDDESDGELAAKQLANEMMQNMRHGK